MRCSFGGIRRTVCCRSNCSLQCSQFNYSSETEIWHKNLKSGSVNRPAYARSVCWSSVRTSKWRGSSEVVIGTNSSWRTARPTIDQWPHYRQWRLRLITSAAVAVGQSSVKRLLLTSHFSRSQCRPIHCVPKRSHKTHGGNSIKSQPIFKILSLAAMQDSATENNCSGKILI